MDEFSFIFYSYNSLVLKLSFSSDHRLTPNRAFLYGDSVMVSFFVRHGKLIMAEECYFYLMASMRKMRIAIPLTYTLEFFQNLFAEQVLAAKFTDGIIRFYVYRENDEVVLTERAVSYYFETETLTDVLALQQDYEIDLIKEININANLFSGLHVHSPENIYGEIYAKENDLDDVLFLNPNKRIARTALGNLLFLQENAIKIPKTSEGAYISPLLENFVTAIHRQRLAEIQEVEMVAFETQKAEEILLISDKMGIFPVTKIRNKIFAKERFSELIEKWKLNFA